MPVVHALPDLDADVDEVGKLLMSLEKRPLLSPDPVHFGAHRELAGRPGLANLTLDPVQRQGDTFGGLVVWNAGHWPTNGGGTSKSCA